MATKTPTKLLIRSANTNNFTSDLNSTFFRLKVASAIVNNVTPKKRVINTNAAVDTTPYQDSIAVGNKRLTKAKNLLVLVVTSLLLMLGLSVAMSFMEVGSSYYYTIMGFYAVLSSGFILLIGLTAIRFVALNTFEQKHIEKQQA